MVFVALKVAHDMKVFPVLANATSPVPGTYLPTAIAKEMVNRPSIGTVESL